MHGMRSLFDFVVECAGNTVVLVHVQCGKIVDEWPGASLTALSDMVSSANDHECRE